MVLIVNTLFMKTGNVNIMNDDVTQTLGGAGGGSGYWCDGEIHL